MRKFVWLLIFLPVIILNGCITIFEKYEINSDGSGTMEYLVDMSELQALIEVFSDSLDLSEINLSETFTLAVPELEIMKGIHNVKIAGNEEKFIFGIRFDFKDMESLNKALGLLFEDKERTETNFVDMKRKKFTRYNAMSDQFSHESMMKEGMSIDESVMKDILDRMQYKISMSFEKDIRRVKTMADYEAEGTKSILIKANFNQMLDEPDLLKTIIKIR